MLLILKLVPSLAWPRTGSLWPPGLSRRLCRAVLLPCPAALMRPFYIIFKLMFSILTLLWIFGFYGPHKGVLSREPHAPIKGIFSSASKPALRSQSHLFFFFSQYYLGRRHAEMCHCVENHVFCWHIVAQK